MANVTVDGQVRPRVHRRCPRPVKVTRERDGAGTQGVGEGPAAKSCSGYARARRRGHAGSRRGPRSEVLFWIRASATARARQAWGWGPTQSKKDDRRRSYRWWSRGIDVLDAAGAAGREGRAVRARAVSAFSHRRVA